MDLRLQCRDGKTSFLREDRHCSGQAQTKPHKEDEGAGRHVEDGVARGEGCDGRDHHAQRGDEEGGDLQEHARVHRLHHRLLRRDPGAQPGANFLRQRGVEHRDAGVDLGAAHDVGVGAAGDHGGGEGDELHQLGSRLGVEAALDDLRDAESDGERGADGGEVGLDEDLVGAGGRGVAVEVVDERVLRLVDPVPEQERRGRPREHHGDADRAVEGDVAGHPERSRDDLSSIRMHRRISQLACTPKLFI